MISSPNSAIDEEIEDEQDEDESMVFNPNDQSSSLILAPNRSRDSALNNYSTANTNHKSHAPERHEEAEYEEEASYTSKKSLPTTPTAAIIEEEYETDLLEQGTSFDDQKKKKRVVKKKKKVMKKKKTATAKDTMVWDSFSKNFVTKKIKLPKTVMTGVKVNTIDLSTSK